MFQVPHIDMPPQVASKYRYHQGVHLCSLWPRARVKSLTRTLSGCGSVDLPRSSPPDSRRTSLAQLDETEGGGGGGNDGGSQGQQGGRSLSSAASASDLATSGAGVDAATGAGAANASGIGSGSNGTIGDATDGGGGSASKSGAPAAGLDEAGAIATIAIVLPPAADPTSSPAAGLIGPENDAAFSSHDLPMPNQKHHLDRAANNNNNNNNGNGTGNGLEGGDWRTVESPAGVGAGAGAGTPSPRGNGGRGGGGGVFWSGQGAAGSQGLLGAPRLRLSTDGMGGEGGRPSLIGMHGRSSLGSVSLASVICDSPTEVRKRREERLQIKVGLLRAHVHVHVLRSAFRRRLSRGEEKGVWRRGEGRGGEWLRWLLPAG